MPNPSPSQEQRVLERTERERELEQDNWTVTIENHRELGEAIASWDTKRTWDIPFAGIAECSLVDGVLTLKIELVADMADLYRCSDCGLVPERPTTYNPSLCINCMKKVCEKCSRRHRNRHHTVQRTIGGDVICTEKSKCGREGCPTCHGIPL